MDVLEPEFLLGVELMDLEHARLVDLVRELQLSINQQGSIRRPLAPIIARLLVQAPAHFENEEQLMAEKGYPGLMEHRAKHQDLVSQLRRLAAELLTNEVVTAQKIHSVISTWLFDHLVTDDRAFAQFAR